MSCTVCGAHVKTSGGNLPKGRAQEMFKTSLQASFMVASLVLTSPCRFPLQRSVREASCGVPCRHTKRLYISRSSKIAQTNSPQSGSCRDLCGAATPSTCRHGFAQNQAYKGQRAWQFHCQWKTAR